MCCQLLFLYICNSFRFSLLNVCDISKEGVHKRCNFLRISGRARGFSGQCGGFFKERLSCSGYLFYSFKSSGLSRVKLSLQRTFKSLKAFFFSLLLYCLSLTKNVLDKGFKLRGKLTLLYTGLNSRRRGRRTTTTFTIAYALVLHAQKFFLCPLVKGVITPRLLFIYHHVNGLSIMLNLLSHPNFFTLRSQPALPQASTKSHSKTFANSTNF